MQASKAQSSGDAAASKELVTRARTNSQEQCENIGQESSASEQREAMLTLWLLLALFRALESWTDFFISGYISHACTSAPCTPLLIANACLCGA